MRTLQDYTLLTTFDELFATGPKREVLDAAKDYVKRLKKSGIAWQDVDTNFGRYETLVWAAVDPILHMHGLQGRKAEDLYRTASHVLRDYVTRSKADEAVKRARAEGRYILI